MTEVKKVPKKRGRKPKKKIQMNPNRHQKSEVENLKVVKLLKKIKKYKKMKLYTNPILYYI